MIYLEIDELNACLTRIKENKYFDECQAVYSNWLSLAPFVVRLASIKRDMDERRLQRLGVEVLERLNDERLAKLRESGLAKLTDDEKMALGYVKIDVQVAIKVG